MKHYFIKQLLLLLIACLLFPVVADAQTREATASKKVMSEKHLPTIVPPNFIFNKDCSFSASDGKSFVVYEAPGYSQKELFDAMVIGIAKIFKYPDKVISKVEPSLITINGITSPCINYYKTSLAEVTYTIQIQFKDGKVRIDAPIISEYPKHDGWGDAKTWINFQKIHDKAKSGLEPEFNKIILAFLKSSFAAEDSEW